MGMGSWLSRFHRADPAVEVYARIPLFRELTPRELRHVAERLQRRRFDAGEALFEQGAPGTGMFVVLEGAVELTQKEEDGTVLELSQVGAGEFLGELALLDDAPRTATARAAEPSEAAVLYRTDLLRLADERPKLGVKIVVELSQIVAERLRRTNRALKEVRLEASAVGEEGAEGGV